MPPSTTSPASGAPWSPAGILSRVVAVEPGEIAALLWSFGYFCTILTSYYIIRPLRDEMGVAVGQAALQNTFTIVFLIMLAAVPVFGWLVSNVARRLIVPIVYGFFIADILLFWVGFRFLAGGLELSRLFFIWASVFNLFTVSLFWILMSELWTSPAAKRLYGFIAAGGSAGAMLGPLVTQGLVALVGPEDVLPAAAFFLALGASAAVRLRRLVPAAEHASASQPTGRDVLAGAVQVWQSPYIFRIALLILLANLVSTFFYLEQSRIVGEVIADRAERVRLFSRLDLAVNVLTIALQVLLTGRLMRRLGVGPTVAALPAVAIAGLLALTVAPSLWVVAAIMIAERAVAFSLASPAVKVLWTVVDPEAKYKAQSFVDTVVFRGGDAASGWMLGHLGAAGMGLGHGAIALVMLPFAGLWLALALALGRRLAERTEAAPAPE